MLYVCAHLVKFNFQKHSTSLDNDDASDTPGFVTQASSLANPPVPSAFLTKYLALLLKAAEVLAVVPAGQLLSLVQQTPADVGWVDGHRREQAKQHKLTCRGLGTVHMLCSTRRMNQRSSFWHAMSLSGFRSTSPDRFGCLQQHRQGSRCLGTSHEVITTCPQRRWKLPCKQIHSDTALTAIIAASGHRQVCGAVRVVLCEPVGCHRQHSSAAGSAGRCLCCWLPVSTERARGA